MSTVASFDFWVIILSWFLSLKWALQHLGGSLIFPASKTVGYGRTRTPWVPLYDVLWLYAWVHVVSDSNGFRKHPLYFCFMKERCVRFHQILWTVSIRFLDIGKICESNFLGGVSVKSLLSYFGWTFFGSHPSSRREFSDACFWMRKKKVLMIAIWSGFWPLNCNGCCCRFDNRGTGLLSFRIIWVIWVMIC